MPRTDYSAHGCFVHAQASQSPLLALAVSAHRLSLSQDGRRMKGSEISKVNPVSDPFPDEAWPSELPRKVCCRASDHLDNGLTKKEHGSLECEPN